MTLPAHRVTRTRLASRLAGVGLTSAGLQVAGVTGVAGRAGPATSATIAQAVDAGTARWQMVRLDVGA